MFLEGLEKFLKFTQLVVLKNIGVFFEGLEQSLKFAYIYMKPDTSNCKIKTPFVFLACMNAGHTCSGLQIFFKIGGPK